MQLILETKTHLQLLTTETLISVQTNKHLQEYQFSKTS